MCTSVASCSAVALAACMALSASSAYISRQWNRHPLGARQRADRQRERARIIGCGVFSCQAKAAHQQERELAIGQGEATRRRKTQQCSPRAAGSTARRCAAARRPPAQSATSPCGLRKAKGSTRHARSPVSLQDLHYL